MMAGSSHKPPYLEVKAPKKSTKNIIHGNSLYTPEDERLEPNNHPIEKENLPNRSFSGSRLIFQGADDMILELWYIYCT